MKNDYYGKNHMLNILGNIPVDARLPPLRRGPSSFNFMQFLRKFGKIVCWQPPPRGLAPPPRQILDP